MNEGDRQKFVTTLGAVAAAFRQELSTPMIEGYWLGLSDMTLEGFAAACQKCIRTCRFMPSAAELREHSGGLSIEMRVELAWSSLLGAIRSYGWNRSVQFDDPCIPAVVDRMGGWQRVSGLPSDELLKWTRKEFAVAYKAHALNMGQDERTSAVLVGAHSEADEYVARIPATYLAADQLAIGAGDTE